MTATDNNKQLSLVVAETLPFLRRYGRALTGSQHDGDRLATATLETLLKDRTIFKTASNDRVALYCSFHAIWSGLGAPVGDGADGLEAAAQKHLSGLTTNSREALLLTTVEGFSLAHTAEIMGVAVSEVDGLRRIALEETADSATGKVLIIEDEPIIAMELQGLVEDLGHEVVGIARTRAEAVVQFRKQKPDLIMSDIQLADNSSGVDAVKDILSETPELPVIFITAFPERLLTGERPEPAFLMTKPYSEDEVRSSVSQAMFFSSTATLLN